MEKIEELRERERNFKRPLVQYIHILTALCFSVAPLKLVPCIIQYTVFLIIVCPIGTIVVAIRTEYGTG